MLNLALLNQLLHCAGHVFDRYARVNTMLIEQIDGIDLESLERGFGDLLDVLWPAIQAHEPGFSVGLQFETELGGYHHFATKWSESFAHQFFVGERAVNFSSIEECDAAFDRRPNQ